jgi:hypothetical protein
VGVTQGHGDHCGHRQGQQDPRKSEQLSPSKHRKDHGDGMKADAIAHKPGHEDHTFEGLADGEDCPYPSESREGIAPLKQRRASSKHEAHGQS